MQAPQWRVICICTLSVEALLCANPMQQGRVAFQQVAWNSQDVCRLYVSVGSTGSQLEAAKAAISVGRLTSYVCSGRVIASAVMQVELRNRSFQVAQPKQATTTAYSMQQLCQQRAPSGVLMITTTICSAAHPCDHAPL